VELTQPSAGRWRGDPGDHGPVAKESHQRSRGAVDVDDDKFLRRISDLIGPYEQIVTSESSGRGTRQRSRSVQEKTILTVAELRELPSGRAICFASGTPAVLIEPQPWFLGKDAAVIEASRRAHSPVGSDPEPVATSPWTVKAIDE